jgi:hypothetical protein
MENTWLVLEINKWSTSDFVGNYWNTADFVGDYWRTAGFVGDS